MIMSAVGPVDEEIRFAFDRRRLENTGLMVDDLQQAFDFLLNAAADQSATEVERAELLSTLVGPNWSTYARGLEPGALLNRLAFALARVIEDTLDVMTAWRNSGDD
jgi:hypothetical protein